MFGIEEYANAIALSNNKCNGRIDVNELNVNISTDGLACYETETGCYYSECADADFGIVTIFPCDNLSDDNRYTAYQIEYPTNSGAFLIVLKQAICGVAVEGSFFVMESLEAFHEQLREIDSSIEN